MSQVMDRYQIDYNAACVGLIHRMVSYAYLIHMASFSDSWFIATSLQYPIIASAAPLQSEVSPLTTRPPAPLILVRLGRHRDDNEFIDATPPRQTITRPNRHQVSTPNIDGHDRSLLPFAAGSTDRCWVFGFVSWWFTSIAHFQFSAIRPIAARYRFQTNMAHPVSLFSFSDMDRPPAHAPGWLET